MKPLHRIALILAVPIVILSACSTSNIDQDWRLEGNENGLVIVSVSSSGMRQFHMTLHWQGVDSSRSAYLEFQDSSDPMAWDSPCRVGLSPNLLGQKDCTGRLAVFELPGGEYEFHLLRGDAEFLGGLRTMDVTATFSVKFMVIPGRASYLGNLHFLFPDEIEWGDDATYHPLVRDMEERDLRLFEQNYPHISRYEVDGRESRIRLGPGLRLRPDKGNAFRVWLFFRRGVG